MRKLSRSTALTLFVIYSSQSLAQASEAPTERRRIRGGETLSSIAREIFGDGLRWRELVRLNPQIKDPNLIRAGRELLIPMPAAPKGELEPAPLTEATVAQAEKEAETIEKVAPVKQKRSPEEIRALFTKADEAFRAHQYDQTQLVYAELLARPDDLKPEEVLEAQHGRGLSRFHQVGCAAAKRDLEASQKDARFQEESTYFLSLCHVESREYEKARAGFDGLVKGQSARFQEPARFYLGVVADSQDRYDEAESHYLDTIDFAEDKRLVDLSKSRVAAMKERRSRSWAENKIFTAVASLGLGWDSNAISLPASFDPSTFGVSSASSATGMGLLVLEAKSPWFKSFDHRTRYTGVLLHNFRTELANAADLQSHDFSTGVDVPWSATTFVGASLGYNIVRVAGAHYMNVPALDLRWMNVTPGEKGAADLEWSASLKSSFYTALTSEGTDADSDGQGYALSLSRTTRKELESWGPGLNFEYRTADGIDSAFWSTTLLGRWDFPVGPKDWLLKLSNEVAYQYTNYFSSTAGRADSALRYTGALARLWTPWFETRLQLSGSKNFSNVESSRYNRLQLNLTGSLIY